MTLFNRGYEKNSEDVALSPVQIKLKVINREGPNEVYEFASYAELLEYILTIVPKDEHEEVEVPRKCAVDCNCDEDSGGFLKRIFHRD